MSCHAPAPAAPTPAVLPRLRMEVAPAGDRGWKVTRAGLRVSRAARKVDAVREAIALARVLAGQGRRITLKIKGRDGRIREERTYPRSSDPRRSRG